MKRTLLFLITSIICSLWLQAANVRISGKVVDSADQPVEFATVRMANSAIGTNTDLKGMYTIQMAQKDTIEMIYSCIGFKTVHHTLVNPKGDITLNVRLYPMDVDLREIEVVGYRQNSNGMQTMNTESYKLAPDVSGGSVEAMITTMPGVNSNNEMSSQYSVRGGSFDENSVYINGVELYRPQLVRTGQQEGLSVINPDMVGNIKFSSGGFPARYADKMSSALDITYRDPQAFEGAAAVSLMGASAAVGTNSGKFSQLSGVRFKKNNSLLSTMETKGEYDPTFFDFQTNLNYKPNERLTFNVLGNIALNHFNFKPQDRETTFGTSEDAKNFKVYFDGAEKDKFETYLGSASATYRLNKATSFTLAVAGFLSNELVTYDISGEYWLNQAGTGGDNGIGGEIGVGKYMEHSRNRLKTAVIQVAFSGTAKYRANNFTYGVGYRHESFTDRTKEWEWRDSAGYSLPTLPEGVHLVYNLSSRQNIKLSRFHAFLEDAIYLSNNFAYMTLNAGLRFSYNGFNKEFLTSPRVNFSMNPVATPNWYYRIGAGLYYQSPFYKEYREMVTDDLGNCVIKLNQNIKSPRSLQFIVGADYTFRAMNRPFKLTAEAYFKHVSDIISYEYDNLKVVYSGKNDSKGFMTGIDLKLFGQFVEGSDSWISVSLMKTQQDLHGKKVPMPTDQRYAINLYFTDYFPKFPKLKFNLRGVLADGLTMTPPHTSRSQTYFRAPAYKRVDLGISWQFIGAPSDKPRKGALKHIKSLVLGIDVFNLLDISNVSSYYWVTDVNSMQYAVPNYLTRRQFNGRLSIEF